MEITSYVFLIIGGLFFLLGGLGILRMPDTFNRIQAGTKATTLGAFSTLIGVAFQNPSWTFKIIIIIVFIAISNPIGSSAIAKATYKAKQIPTNLVQDDLALRGEKHDTI
ncbi:MAG: monovalent cation/H(+) antiporter subunit G [Candidatus Izemoplasmatales bacterium]|jgi:multicomponent Na+:H+ antiporter subunit G|nr:monovalent cation/H(+) antiporter subunit G [Candidatus Izemoplasmatales bacterium]